MSGHIRCAAVFSLLLVGVASAVDTFTVDIELTGSDTVAPGGSTTYVIRGHLTDQANMGLAFFALDLQMTGPQAINLGTAIIQAEPAGGEMDTFVRNLGYSVDYGGTPIANELIQAGGGQNTINNNPALPPNEPFPSGAVLLDIGNAVPDGVVLLEGTLTLPMSVQDDEQYTLQIKPNSLFANMITNVNMATNPPTYTVTSVNAAIGSSITVTVLGCVDADLQQITHTVGYQPNPAVAQTRPCSGYIDPRIESSNGMDLNRGLSSVQFLFSSEMFGDAMGGALTPANFIVTQTGGALAPSVMSAVKNGVTPALVTVTLSRPITLQQWTTIAADVYDGNGCEIRAVDNGGCTTDTNEITVGFLPGDIDQNRSVQPLDLARLRQFLTANAYHPTCGLDLDFFDIDRNNATPQPLDLLRFRQIVTGANPATRNWTGQSIPVCPN